MNKAIKYLGWFCCLFFMLETAASTANSIKKWQCGYQLRQSERKLAKREPFIQLQTVDCFDSMLCIYNYNFQDTTEETRALLADIQGKTQDIIAEYRADSTMLSYLESAYLLLSKTFYYQNDFDNTMRYLRMISYKSPLQTEAAFFKLRMATAMDNWDEVENLLEKLSYLAEEKDTLKGSALEYALLEADYRLHCGRWEGMLQRLQYLEAQPNLDAHLKQRLNFIMGQYEQIMHQERTACQYYSNVLSQAVENKSYPSAIFAYAYVNRDDCRRQLEQQRQDSLRWVNLFDDNDLFEPTMVESSHDSDFIHSMYPYYFQDLASRYFLDEEIGLDEEECDEEEDGEYFWYVDDNDTLRITEEMRQAFLENWDSVSIHIPKADFSHLEDTIRLTLIDSNYSLPFLGEVSSEFGWRRYRYHYGIDLRKKVGDSVYCLFDGVVRIAKRNKTYGNLIVVRHLNGLETFYAHNSKLLVEQNQEVKAGQLIALAGNTGRSTGPHLHLEVRYKGVPFNPRYMIDFDSARLVCDTMTITRETFNYVKSGSSSKGSGSSSAVYYKVKSGDTLSRIALKYHTSVKAIKRLNGLRSDFIRDGQRLRVL